MHYLITAAALPLVALTACSAVIAQDIDPESTPPEFGDVAWGRKYEEAAQKSASSGRPILLMFQEVPG